MGKEIIIEELNYLTGDLMEISGHTDAIARIEIFPLESANTVVNNFDELLEYFDKAHPETNKFSAYVYTKSGDIFKIDTLDNRKVLIPITGVSLIDELDEVSKGYDNVVKYITYKSRQSSLLDLTVSENFYETLYRLYYANEQGFLTHYVDWNKEMYITQMNMLYNQNYPLKLLEIYPKELYTLEADLGRFSQHWKALSQSNLSLASAVETMANNMAWYVSTAMDMTTSQYIYRLSENGNIYKSLVQDYNSLITKSHDDERLRTLFGA